MSVRPARTRVLAASVAALALGLLPTAAPAATANRPAELAESFQAGELRNDRMPSSYVPGADWGLTIDTIYMLSATGGNKRLLNRMGNVLAKNADSYTTSTFGTTTYRGAGATAKVLLAADVLGEPVKDFGGTNYRRALTKFIVSRGADAGRLSDRNSDDTDYSNTLTQSLGVIGLARTGRSPQAVVDHLLEQQCRGGGFTLSMTTGRTCNRAGGSSSVDATAYAIQALYAARAQGRAAVPAKRLKRAVRWLVGAQRRNGSFGSDADITTSNTNSTGLAAQALADAGRDTAVREARRWVAKLQVRPRTAGEARDVVGAIAYDRAALKAARADGVTDRDQFRRATAMGAFAFAPEPLRTLSAP